MKAFIKYLIVGIVCLLIGIGIGSSGSKEKSTNTSQEVKTNNETTPTQEQQIEETKPEEKISLKGIGQKATEKFNLNSGLVVFKLKHSGNGHFGVWLLDSNGNQIELLANTVGNFDGSKAVKINKEGEYLLDISADGDWTVEVE